MSGEVIVRNHYWSLAVAAGAGYLLGGGFPTRRLIGLGLAASGQMATTAVLRDLISSQAKGSSRVPAYESVG
jgi:hypothetical protein